MSTTPVPPPPSQTTRATAASDYISKNRTLVAVIAALALLLLGAAGAWIAQNQVTIEEAQKVRDLRGTRDDLQEQLDIAQNRLEEVSAENENRKSREADLAAAEAAVATRENEVTPREADLKAREDAVAKLEGELEQRSAALSANEDDRWWVAKVEECLSRGGSYVNASVSTSSYLGNDFSCYTG
ncbi:hypothetical protein ACFWE5_00895 [Cellulosimicrobium funkei]|uniref:hypothetical protein n=1 Tax=Cellulosimicrobium funkei TaxID=264251 RepID=UPI00366554AD